MFRLFTTVAALLSFQLTLAAADLSYLHDNNPWYPHTNFPKLTTPQWVGEEGVDAVVVRRDDARQGVSQQSLPRTPQSPAISDKPQACRVPGDALPDSDSSRLSLSGAQVESLRRLGAREFSGRRLSTSHCHLKGDRSDHWEQSRSTASKTSDVATVQNRTRRRLTSSSYPHPRRRSRRYFRRG